MEKKKKEDKYYLPRDISWMYFNRRILQEAMKERVPAHPTNPVEGCADANPKTMLPNDT